MKRWMILILSVLLAFSMTACGKTETASSDMAITDEEREVLNKSYEELNEEERLTLSIIDIKVNSAESVATEEEKESYERLKQEKDKYMKQILSSYKDDNEADTQETASKGSQKTDFQLKCEGNAEQYPADIGKVLFNNANNSNFKGMNYYFKGEIVGGITLENTVGDGKAWLVRNDKGYVMPIQKSHFEASMGDVVEVWGTLSGLKYSSSDFGVENVVGATGSMHAMMISVNGEMKY